MSIGSDAALAPWRYNFEFQSEAASQRVAEIENALFGGVFGGFFASLFGREIQGTDNGETLFGSILADDINALGGPDTVFGGVGNDMIDGGDGDDTIEGGRGQNSIDGGAGVDVVQLAGSFEQYEFDYRDDGVVVITGDGVQNSVANVEFVESEAEGRVEIGSFQVDFSLQILHASDLEGGVDAIGNAPNFAALVDTFEGEFANSILLSAGDNYIPGPFFNAAADRSLREPLQAAYQNLFDEPDLTNIREGSGRVDIAIMNVLGFDASAVGNHEFDAGPDAFADIIGDDIRGETLADVRNLGAQFPYLAANLDFSGEPALAGAFDAMIRDSSEYADQIVDVIDEATGAVVGQTVTTGAAPIAPATIVTEGGEQIGVVGATTQLLDSITSNGGVTVTDVDDDPSVDMADLAAVLQPTVDSLTGLGVNKIILVSHLQQLSLELELASLLSGVDVIIAGGSDTRLTDANDALRDGDVSEGEYPQVVQNVDGDATLVVSTDGEYSYLGRLVVDFDANGNVIAENYDPAVSGAFATDEATVLNVTGAATLDEAIAGSEKATEVQNLTNAVRDVVVGQDANVFGLSDVFIEGRREQVRTEETNLGNLTADANLAIARMLDTDPLEVTVSLKNGGGIRAPIGEIGQGSELLPPQANETSGKNAGEVSQLDIVNALRFNNGLSVLTLTEEQLVAVLEHAVSASAPGATPGQFPQVSGVKFSFDPAQPADDRLVNAALLNDDGSVKSALVQDGVFVGDADAEVRIVTLDFLADGGDAYPYPDFEATSNRVDLAGPDLTDADGAAVFAPNGTEQDALAEILASQFPIDADDATPTFGLAETPVDQDQRIQVAQLGQADEEFFTSGVTPSFDLTIV